jgi:hypothetical protein
VTLVWALWFGGFLLAFAAIEGLALLTGRPTLSRTVWRTEARFPILSFLIGAVVGSLAIHFFGWIPACNP